jgi:hypothetical protein
MILTHDYPPIPCRDWDWSATLDGYEPGDPIGRGPTPEAAAEDLQELISDAAPLRSI